MAVIRWDPFRDFMTLQNEVARLFERSYGAGEPSRRAAATAVWTPAADVYEKDGNLVVDIELPGMDAEDVDVTVEDGNLAVRGERTFSAEVKEENAYRIERRYGVFERVLSLPEDVDTSAIAAQVNNGVLTITLPRKPESRPKQIKVEVGRGKAATVETKARKKA